MKVLNFFFLIVIVFLISCTAKEETWLKVGTELYYDVEQSGREYQFILKVVKLTPDVEFDWRMTDPVNNDGSILMTAAATPHLSQ